MVASEPEHLLNAMDELQEDDEDDGPPPLVDRVIYDSSDDESEDEGEMLVQGGELLPGEQPIVAAGGSEEAQAVEEQRKESEEPDLSPHTIAIASETADLQLGIFFISWTDGSNQSCVGIFQPTAVERHKLMDFKQN